MKYGFYNNASEVAGLAMRLLEDDENARQVAIAEVRAPVQAGIASGRGRPAAEVFDRLESKYQDMSEQRDA